MMDEALPDFTGKVVTVQLTTEYVCIALEQVRFEQQLGKVYLVGRQLPYPGRPDWADGATHYIAPEQLAYFTVFDSPDVYFAQLSRSTSPTEEHQQERRGWFGRRG